MTTKQKFEKMLFEMGVSESQASQIMELSMPRFSELLPKYRVTWERPADEYPDTFYNVGFAVVVKKAALDWIDANLPMAWFRALFI